MIIEVLLTNCHFDELATSITSITKIPIEMLGIEAKSGAPKPLEGLAGKFQPNMTVEIDDLFLIEIGIPPGEAKNRPVARSFELVKHDPAPAENPRHFPENRVFLLERHVTQEVRTDNGVEMAVGKGHSGGRRLDRAGVEGRGASEGVQREIQTDDLPCPVPKGLAVPPAAADVENPSAPRAAEMAPEEVYIGKVESPSEPHSKKQAARERLGNGYVVAAGKPPLVEWVLFVQKTGHTVSNGVSGAASRAKPGPAVGRPGFCGSAVFQGLSAMGTEEFPGHISVRGGRKVKQEYNSA